MSRLVRSIARWRRRALVAVVGLAIVACTSRADASRTARDATLPARAPDGTVYAYDRLSLDTTRAPGSVIDSVFPMPEMIRRFQRGLAPVTALRGGARSRQQLVAAFIGALATRDKSRLGTLVLSRAEFAYVYFPNAPDGVNPNGLPPTLRWDGIVRNSEKGVARALTRIGGKPLTLESLDCRSAPVSTGATTLHDGCTVRIVARDGTRFDGRLFGSIIEYAGRFKFVSYTNDM